MEQAPLILVVDDEPEFREIFSVNLLKLGYRVETAENGTEALTKAKELHPALILMDVKMPGLSGIETLLKLKEDPETKDEKVMFLTNFGEITSDLQKADEKFSLDVGAIGYLHKSEDFSEVADRVKKYLAH